MPSTRLFVAVAILVVVLLTAAWLAADIQAAQMQRWLATGHLPPIGNPWKGTSTPDFNYYLTINAIFVSIVLLIPAIGAYVLRRPGGAGPFWLMFWTGAWLAFVWWRRREIPKTPWFLRAVAISGAGAVLALWCGWIVTEVGRQPWIVQGYMRTSEAVTEANGIWFSFALVLLLYAAIGTIAIGVLRAMSRRWREGTADPEGTPYAPPAKKSGRWA